MAQIVTRTKIILPQRRREILTRSRLIELLSEQLDYKLILVIAPAGYGKTSLLLDFARQVDLPVCWFSLDTYDQSILRFIAHFIAAIHQIFPTFGEQSNVALEAADHLSPDIPRLISVIVNDIYEHIQEHFLFVLDDYHLISNQKEIEQFTNQLVREVSENCHLVLSSRTLLSLPDLALLTARMQVAGLGYQDLAFRPDEIQSLVRQNHQVQISNDEAEDLTHRTEGWITGLLLTTQTMWQKNASLSPVSNITGVGLYDFLAQQVLDQQPATIRDFLLRTSFLDEFDVNLCEAIWGKENHAAASIAALLKDNLFVLPVGETGQTIRYHHLFQDFLQARFELEHPGEIGDLLHHIADTYIQQEEWEKAYTLYQRLDDLKSIANLVERVGSKYIRDSRLEILAKWIDALPEDSLSERPALLSHKGAVLIIKGQVETGLNYLNQAEQAQRQRGVETELATILARRATARRILGDYQGSLEDGYEALAICERYDDLRPIKAEALRVIGMSQYHLGRLAEATEKFQKSLDECYALQELANVAMVHMELGMCLRSSGNFRQALEQYKQAMDFWHKVNNTVRLSGVLNNMGVLYHISGDYIHAIELFEEALEHARHNGMQRSEAYLLCSIGDLYLELDADTNAQDAYHRSREIAEQINEKFLLLYITLFEARQYRVKGNLNQAFIRLQDAKELVQQSKSSYETALFRMEEGLLNLASRHPRIAVNHLSDAARLFSEGGQVVEAARANLILASAYEAARNLPNCLSALAQAFTLAASLDSRHTLVVTGRDLQIMLKAVSADETQGTAAQSLLNQIHQFESQLPGLRRGLRSKVSTILFAPPKITIHILGRMVVEQDGEPVNSSEWVNQKRVRELLFYLLAHPEGKTREEIGVDLWPDSSRAQLKLQFKNAIYRLRYALGPDIALFDGVRYFFNQDLDYEYDVGILDENYSLAKKSTSEIERISYLRAVVDVYRGPYLPEAMGIWVLSERERLWKAYLDAALTLAHIYLNRSEYHTCLELCHTLLRQDTCLEDAHRLAMRAYAALGNRAAVRQQYHDCYCAMREEIDSDPSPQTFALYQSLIEN